MPKRLLLAAVLAGSVAAHADYQSGVDAYRAGDFETALAEFRALAERGVVVAYTNLGYMHALGEGVPADLERAAHWFRRAAEAGDAAAQITLGVLYVNGEGVPRDHPTAYGWLNVAATNGRSDALDYMSALVVRMSNEETKRAQAIARDLFERFGDGDAKRVTTSEPRR